MGNRLPIYALAALVIIAIIWRIATPKPPIPPGPLGGIPNWSSSGKIGEMGPSAVNPAEDKWAGAWNQVTDNKELRSAVWFIDFNKEEAKYCLLDKGSYTSSLSWGDNNTVRALVNDSDKPATIEQSKIITINAADARKIDSKNLDTALARILSWPHNSDKFLAQAADVQKMKLGIWSENGMAAPSKIIELNIPSDSIIYPVAAMSKDGSVFAFGVYGEEAGGNATFYVADAKTGAVKELFTSEDLPGRLDDMWIEPNAGIAMLCSNLGKFGVYFLDTKNPNSKILPLKDVPGLAADKVFKDFPKEICFINYSGGYKLANGLKESKKIFTFDKETQKNSNWLVDVQDGRLYKRRDGNYVSVSYAGGLVDIRVFEKSGKKISDLLKRH